MQSSSIKDLNDLCGVDRLVHIFLDLISYNTQANLESTMIPSSAGQLRLGAHILSLLQDLQVQATQTKDGVIICKLEASEGFEEAKHLCLLAHLDTACDYSGENIKASLVKNYKGAGIKLENGLILDDDISPNLKQHIGDDIIVTDGTTLLGADDKAGISILLLMLENLVTSDIKHGPLTVIFSVDEEIGKSCNYIDVASLGCDFAVTIDGTALGELDIATFNAMSAQIKVKGKPIHTAVAYKKMVNACDVLVEFLHSIPYEQRAQTTYGKEGFYHVVSMQASMQEAKALILLRDFDIDNLYSRKEFLEQLKILFNNRYADCIDIDYTMQYKNMYDILQSKPQIVELCKNAYHKAQVKLIENYVRGGTDGSNLSYKGLPCPNIFTGALNCHGPYECLIVQAFHKAYDVVLNLVQDVALATKG